MQSQIDRVPLVASVLRELHEREIVPAWTHKDDLPYCAGGSVTSLYFQKACYLLKQLTGFQGLPEFTGAGGGDFVPHSVPLERLFNEYMQRLDQGTLKPKRLSPAQLAKIEQLERWLKDPKCPEHFFTVLAIYAFHCRKRRYRPTGPGYARREAEFKERMANAWWDKDDHYSDAKITFAEQWMQDWEITRQKPNGPTRARPQERPLPSHRSRLSPLAARP